MREILAVSPVGEVMAMLACSLRLPPIRRNRQYGRSDCREGRRSCSEDFERSEPPESEDAEHSATIMPV